MKLNDITPGQTVRVTRGYTRHTATVDKIYPDGKVSVTYTDIDRDEILRTIPTTRRGGVLGGVFTPNQITSL